MAKLSEEDLLNHLKVLVNESCTGGHLQSEVTKDGVTVKMHFAAGPAGNAQLAKKVAALLAQETM
jgi:hypothetical protein